MQAADGAGAGERGRPAEVDRPRSSAVGRQPEREADVLPAAEGLP